MYRRRYEADEPDTDFDRHHVDVDVFVGVLREATAALEERSITHVVIGGVASAVYGRPRWSTDIDLLVAPDAAHDALDALGAAGFATQETNPAWIFKATRRDVLVDVIFRCIGDIYLDADLLARSRPGDFHGLRIPIVSPEDLVVLKAIAHAEATTRHWFDALSVLTDVDLDWPYLVWRARHSPRRVLSLLLYAQAEDITVPNDAVNELIGQLSVEGVGSRG